MADGKSLRQIATELKINLSTARNWATKFKKDIELLKAENQKQLLQAYTLIKQTHLTNLAETLTRIDSELLKRDFTEVRTEKLLEYKLKYQTAILEEYEKEPQAFIITPIESIEDYKAEYQRIYNAVATGKLAPNTAKTLMELLAEKRGVQRRLYDVNNPTPFDVDISNGNPY